jgi:uncharacterized hydrophobic protein (TIGR00271 family)
VRVTPRNTFVYLQDRLAAWLGAAPSDRSSVIANMLRRGPGEATGYWLQLVVSVAIATLGLALGSTAVVIGAMLIAPLMGPIVKLGMGLAVGSPLLVLHAGARITMSAVISVASAALLTRMLPFHELNTEIAARSTPTLLDLLTAGFCAVAGVYASMRPGSEMASTAAGTSIGISLAPPLCASGFGIGTSMWEIARGAALLFLTNFVAIVVVGTIVFAAAGFHQVDVAALEAEERGNEDGGRLLRAATDRLQTFFAWRGGALLRLLMPLLLLGLLYVPLRRALDEVAWQIQARNQVEAAVAGVSARVLESRIVVERGEVSIGLVILGTAVDAEASRKSLDAELRVATGVTPRIEVIAVPDAKAFAGLEASLRAPAVAALPISAAVRIEEARGLVRDAVQGRWPSRTVGDPLAVSITDAGDALEIVVVHIGAALDGATRETLEKSLEDDLGQTVTMMDAPLPRDEIVADRDELAFVARVAPLIESSKRANQVSLCVTEPPKAPTDRGGTVDNVKRLDEVMNELLQGARSVTRQVGDGWAIHFIVGSCPAKQKAEPKK